MVVYTGKRKVKDLVKFLDKEMEKAKKVKVQVFIATQLSTSRQCWDVCVITCMCLCLLDAIFVSLLKINFFLSRLQEDEERRKYIEAAKAEDAKKANATKDEL